MSAPMLNQRGELRFLMRPEQWGESMRCLRWPIVATVIAAGAWPAAAELDPATRAKYGPVIDKGRDRLVTLSPAAGTGEAALCGYALIKAGLAKSHPRILEQTAATVERINRGAYQSGSESQAMIYEAACDAMFLAEVDPKAYKPQLEVIRDYLVRRQLSNGAWCYPTTPDGLGDTSVTQFALLGLWAVRRSGVDVPPAAWDKCARWLIAAQRKDGGFAYRPNETSNKDFSIATHSMSAAGLGSLLVVKRNIYSANPLSDVEVSIAASGKKRFGVLENLPPERPGAMPALPAEHRPNVSRDALEQAIRQSINWLGDHYEAIPAFRSPLLYYHYTCERAGALLNTESFGSHKWYEEGAKTLVQRQRPTGEWEDSTLPISPAANTAFALLFLSRATQSIVGPPAPRIRLHGGGLLGGGRGLPDDLANVDVRDGVVKQRAPKAAIDALLADLEKPTTVVDESEQIKVVEAIQLEQRDQLVGQIDRLRKLVRDPRPEVRQVAVWALGRSDDLRQAPLLIAAVADANPDVAAEASLALCVLSRRPEGVRIPGSKDSLAPTEPPEPTADDDESSYGKRFQDWQNTARKAWHEWYLQVRPYDERDDQHQLRTK